MSYHIRYTCSGELQEGIVDFIMRNANKYIIAREIATREHIQCYVETRWCKKTWVNEFNKKFKGMDRRDKYVEPDKGATKFYVCKDGDIISKRGFTDEDIENFRASYHATHSKPPISLKIEESLISPPVIVTQKVKKQKTPTFMTICRNELEEEYPEKEWTKNDRPIVFKKIMHKLGQGCRNLDHIIISRMTYGVMNSLIKDKKEWHEYWYQKAFGEMLNPHEEEDMSLDDF